MTEFAKKELLRLVKMIPTVDPTTAQYQMLLRSIECLDAMGPTIDGVLELEDESAPEKGAELNSAIELQNITNFPAKGTADPLQAEQGSSSPEIKSVTESAGSREEAPSYDAPTVRAALVDARIRGVDTKPLFEEFGVGTFQELDPKDYGRFMAKLQEVVE